MGDFSLFNKDANIKLKVSLNYISKNYLCNQITSFLKGIFKILFLKMYSLKIELGNKIFFFCLFISETNKMTFYFTGNLTFKLIEFLKRVQISKI